MKLVLRNILLLFILSFLVRCNKEDITSRDYPRLKTLPVTEITSEGAQFNAEITLRGDYKIIKYGFAWGDSEDPTLENSDRVIYSEDIQTDKFSEMIKANLEEDVYYFVRAFVETDDFIVYGENVSFNSLGRKAPEVFSFGPTSGTWGDTIDIIGDNFSNYSENIIVELGLVTTQVISSTDSTISIVVPSQNNDNIVNLRVSIAGNSSTANENFNYLIPTVTSVDPINVTFGDTVTIHGINFGKFMSWNKIILDNSEAEIVAVIPNRIEFIVPTNLVKKINSIELTSVGIKITLSQELILNPPEFNSFSPKQAIRPNQIITIHGKNFSPNRDNSSVRVKGFNANILNLWQDSIQLEMPDEIIPDFHVSVYDTVDISLSIAGQSVNSVELLEVYWSSTWTRKNDFPGLGRHDAVAFSIGNYGYFGTGVTEGGNFRIPLNDFWKYDPTSDQWFELNNLPGDPRGWASSFTIGNTGYVGLGAIDYHLGNPDDNGDYFKEFFSYNPIQDEWKKIADYPDIGRHSAAAFSINDKGYISTGWLGRKNPINNINGTNDAWQYDPSLDLWTEIEDFPNVTYNAVGFQLGNKGYIYDRNELYEYRNNSWTKLTAPFLESRENIAFGINGFAYFGLGLASEASGSNQIYEYDPTTTEGKAISLSSNDKRWGASVFVIDNKAYIIGGCTYSNRRIYLNDVWEFDPSKPEL